MRVPILTALLVMGLFGCASYMVNRAETALQSAQMEQAAQRIDARIDAQVSLLYSVRAFFMNSDEVTRKELQGFLSAAEISKRAPGMQGVGYAMADRVEPDGTVRRLLQARYGLDREPWPETDQSKRFPIVFLEPNDERNRAALGYDMYSNAVRRQAMDMAIQTGQPAATEKVTLVQEIDEDVQPGFLIYLPLISTVDGVSDASDSRSTVEGFIYAPFRARDLLEAALSEAELKTIGVTVYVGEETPDTLLFSNDEAPGEGNLHVIQVANMDWLLRLHPHDELLSGWLAPSKLILFFGVLVSLLSALIARGQTQKLRASNALSTERLARAEDRDLMLREITHRMKNAIARIQSIAQLSANNSQTVDSYVNTFVGRLQAMANAQDLLTQTRWKSSGLRALLETEIGQIVDTNSENVSLSGPTVHLDGGQAQAVGLVVHELATNASKYGAFKQGGKVDINWAVKKHDEGAQFDLVWRETGLTNRPDLSRKGFGTDLAALMIDGQMKGKFSRRIDSGDLVIRIGFPYTLE